MIRSIDLNELLNEGPPAYDKVLKALCNAFAQIEIQIEKLSSDAKAGARAGEHSEFSSTALTTLIKNSEKTLLTKLNVQTTKLNTKIEFLEDGLATVKVGLTNEIAAVLGKVNALNLDKRLDWVEGEVLRKVKNEMIDPLEYELKENYKTVQMIEQMMKVQTWNIESSQKEFNSRFDTHKEKIHSIEQTVSNFMKQADDMILKIISPIKKSVELCEITIRNLYTEFEKDMQEVLHDLKGKDEDRDKRFNELSESIYKFKDTISQSEQKIKMGFINHIKEIEEFIKKIQKSNESFKQEIRVSQYNCYENAKGELMTDYKQDLKAIEEKLAWLPSDLEDISDMTPMEARLYTIETRIRTEEMNRMNQINAIFEGKS